jgi:hypothetical protein
MNQILFVLGLVAGSINAYGLVGGVSALGEGESRIGLESQIEQGKIEPNENRASFQDADIKINRIKYAYGLSDFAGLKYTSLYLEYGQFTSNEERVGATLFYEEDKGSYASVGFSAELLHDADRVFGFYINVLPSPNYNKKKFSNPRLDKFSFGLNSSFNISDNVFYKNLFHYGSGDGTDQNSYFAIDTGFGFRLEEIVRVPAFLSTTLFLESDLSERFDSSYDTAFSAAGRTDRVRAFKYGTLIGLNIEITKNISASLEALQKLGGYDARSTQINRLGLAYKF